MESEITALQLNNLIVQCRNIVKKAKIWLVRKTLNQIHVLKNKSGTADQKNKNQRRVDRLLSELKEYKKINNDEVTKFALVNTASFADLMRKSPAVDKVLLYKVAFCDPVIKKIDEIREKYPRWPIEIPFILQRLGLQYKTKQGRGKESRNVAKIAQNVQKKRKLKNKKQPCTQLEDNKLIPTLSKQSESLLEIGKWDTAKASKRKAISDSVDRSDGAIVNTKHSALKDMHGNAAMDGKSPLENSTHPGKPPANINKLKEGRFGQMEVRRLKLDEIFDDEALPDFSQGQVNIEKPCRLKKSSREDQNLDPFFADDDNDANMPSGSIKEDNVELDFLLDDSELSSDRGKSKGRFNDKKHKEQSYALAKPRNEENLDKDRKTRKSNVRNANLVPLGQPSARPTSIGENRKQRRLKLRQEAEKSAELAALHPSWRAKKMHQQSISMVPAGKKIKFIDDDI